MSNYLTADARAPGEASSGGMPLSSLYHEIGLAAVATELNLQLNALEPVARRSRWVPPRFSWRGTRRV